MQLFLFFRWGKRGKGTSQRVSVMQLSQLLLYLRDHAALPQHNGLVTLWASVQSLSATRSSNQTLHLCIACFPYGTTHEDTEAVNGLDHAPASPFLIQPRGTQESCCEHRSPRQAPGRVHGCAPSRCCCSCHPWQRRRAAGCCASAAPQPFTHSQRTQSGSN